MHCRRASGNAAALAASRGAGGARPQADRLQPLMPSRLSSLLFTARARELKGRAGPKGALRGHKRAHNAVGVVGWSALAALVFATMACGDTGAVQPRAVELHGGGQPIAYVAPCKEGEVRDCSLKLAEHGDLISCYIGAQVCEAGAFGECSQGYSYDIERIAAREAVGAHLRTLAFSPAVDCNDNPCNAYCRQFLEQPPDGLGPEVDSSAPAVPWWLVGRREDFLEGALSSVLREPCEVGADCQQGTECSDPALELCSHSVCEVGEALPADCNRCADSVCAHQPSCCGVAPACAHDPCDSSSGDPLDPQCDRCVAAICDSRPECCEAGWNEACVRLVASECEGLGQSCGCPPDTELRRGQCYALTPGAQDLDRSDAVCLQEYGPQFRLADIASSEEEERIRALLPPGSLSSVWLGAHATGEEQWTWQRRGETFFEGHSGDARPSAYSNWAPDEPPPGAIGLGLALDPRGGWRSAARTTPMRGVCEAPPTKLQPASPVVTWGPECVAQVEARCGASCESSPFVGYGACTPRLPAALRPSCSDVDLTLAAPCVDENLPTAVVCNHGQGTASSGVRVSVEGTAGNSECTTTEDIPPGRCIQVACPALVAGDRLEARLTDSAEAECDTANNRAVFEPVACAQPLCESTRRPAASIASSNCSLALRNGPLFDTEQARVRLGGQAPVPRCAAGEEHWGNSCYYTDVLDARTSPEARERCRSRGEGWDLVALNTGRENRRMLELLPSESGEAQPVYIGLSDAESEGEHYWTNGSCRQFVAFAEDEPDDTVAPGSEQCAVLMLGGAHDLQWEDRSCDDKALTYVCEGPLRDARGGCEVGQLEGPDGACYSLETTLRTWDDAGLHCESLGGGWALASIGDERVHDFLAAWLDCEPTWFALPREEIGSPHFWKPGVSVDLSKTRPFMGPEGEWQTDLPGASKRSVCRGPGASPELTAVSGPEECSSDSEFFFEPGPAPARLTLCPATCEKAAVLGAAPLSVDIACREASPPAQATTHTQLYPSNCQGSSTHWDFLYYNAITPADSRVRFSVRSAPTEEELAGKPFLQVADAAAVDGTELCQVAPPSCPIDLFQALGFPDQQHSLLELRMQFVPGTSGEAPYVRDWDVRFSCPPNQ